MGWMGSERMIDIGQVVMRSPWKLWLYLKTQYKRLEDTPFIQKHSTTLIPLILNTLYTVVLAPSHSDPVINESSRKLSLSARRFCHMNQLIDFTELKSKIFDSYLFDKIRCYGQGCSCFFLFLDFNHTRPPDQIISISKIQHTVIWIQY